MLLQALPLCSRTSSILLHKPYNQIPWGRTSTCWHQLKKSSLCDKLLLSDCSPQSWRQVVLEGGWLSGIRIKDKLVMISSPIVRTGSQVQTWAQHVSWPPSHWVYLRQRDLVQGYHGWYWSYKICHRSVMGVTCDTCVMVHDKTPMWTRSLIEGEKQSYTTSGPTWHVPGTLSLCTLSSLESRAWTLPGCRLERNVLLITWCFQRP